MKRTQEGVRYIQTSEGDLMAFDFSMIENVLSEIFDNDLISIGRKMTITDPDGFEVETDPTIPIYENVPCHIAFKSQDNPDVANDSTKPVIMSLTIYCNSMADIQNGDYINAQKRGADGTVLEEYTGIAGEPMQYQSRTVFNMGISKWT